MGLLALRGAAYDSKELYPLDVLGAETEGMIGYMIEQELGNLLPVTVPLATILTMVEVDPNDPGFQDPTKFIGPVHKAPAMHGGGASAPGRCPTSNRGYLRDLLARSRREFAVAVILIAGRLTSTYRVIRNLTGRSGREPPSLA